MQTGSTFTSPLLPSGLFSHPNCRPLADGATAIALLIYAAPLYWRSGRTLLTEGSQGDVTADYISSMRLLSNTSR